MSEIPVYDANGNAQDKLKLDIELSKKDASSKTFSCAVKVLAQNWRQGTVSCKGRSDVSFANRKPWRQKGTGRARAGTPRSPLWRKGGVTFGPQPRTRKLAVNRKHVKLALNNIFYNILDENNLHCLDFDLQKDKPSTKVAFKALKQMGVAGKKIVLFLPFGDEANFASFRNIANVNVFCFDQPNAYDLSNGDCWIFLKKDMDSFKNMVLEWN
jgi:large subunit ribosomal protein L4